MQITNKDLEIIASMHISSRIKDAGLKTPGNHYRFFYDKVKLFNEFDSESIILKKNDRGEIAGILIYTYDEAAFNDFSNPSHARFYYRLLKTLIGYYGYRFGKFFAAARSMLGKNTTSAVPQVEQFGKIWVLLVMEECRRQGIAVKLLEDCIAAMQQKGIPFLRVTVRTDNEPAIKAYQKSGFEIIGNCRESSGESYVMQLPLANDSESIDQSSSSTT